MSRANNSLNLKVSKALTPRGCSLRALLYIRVNYTDLKRETRTKQTKHGSSNIQKLEKSQHIPAGDPHVTS
jgi:hypothetical protein